MSLSKEPCRLRIEFCGEVYEVGVETPFSIGRDGDLVVDDNRFLHRRFLTIERQGELWMLHNVGSQLTATVADANGRLEAFLAPGAALPIVFPHTSVAFAAGPTSYSLLIACPDAVFVAPPDSEVLSGGDAETTVGVTSFTADQRLLLVALAEPRLRGDGAVAVTLPTSSEAARRLEWTLTKFNRKLDNVCQKLERLGVRGLHGGPDRLASSRRVRLVEYAVATRLVTREHLSLLDHAADD